MTERIVPILERMRRRERLAEAGLAAVIGATTGAAAATLFMLANVVREAHGFIGVAATTAACIWAFVSAARHGARRFPRRGVATASVVVFLAMALLAALHSGLSRTHLLLLAPVLGLLAGGAAWLTGPDLRSVAIDVDRRAALAERLASALELERAGDESPFAQAVRRQAVEHSARLRLRVERPAPAAWALLGLTCLAALLMLPWGPMESPEAARQRAATAAAAQAGRDVQEQARQLARQLAGGDAVQTLAQLERLVGSLRRATPEELRNGQARSAELKGLERALRRVLASGALEPTAQRRLENLLANLEQFEGELATAAGPGGPDYGSGGAGRSEPAGPVAAASAPVGWVAAFRREYEPHVSTAATGPEAGEPPAPVLVQTPPDEAWAQAQRRAERALAGGQVPPPYRQLVRDFFAVTPPGQAGRSSPPE